MARRHSVLWNTRFGARNARASEELEQRRLFATGIFVDAAAHSVAILGTSQADAIVVAESPTLVSVTLNGNVRTFATDTIRTIEILGFEGDDAISVSGSLSATIYGGAGSDLVEGGEAADQLFANTPSFVRNALDLSDFGQLKNSFGRLVTTGPSAGDYVYDGLVDLNDFGWLKAHFGKPVSFPSTDPLSSDVLMGRGGDDELIGAQGNDVIDGGDGDDQLIGGDGEDQLTGGIGDDRLTGGLGNDYLVGGKGADTLVGDEGDDQLSGDSVDEPGNPGDTVQGGEGHDTLFDASFETLPEAPSSDESGPTFGLAAPTATYISLVAHFNGSGWNSSRKEAVQGALDYLGHTLFASFPGERLDIDIAIDPTLSEQGADGRGGPTLMIENEGRAYPVALFNHLVQEDYFKSHSIAPGTVSHDPASREAMAELEFVFDDSLSASRLQAVVAHEIVHGLGFIGPATIERIEGVTVCGLGQLCIQVPTRHQELLLTPFQDHIVSSTGKRLADDYLGLEDGVDGGSHVSLLWDGPFGVKGASEEFPVIYVNPSKPGSTLTHLDDDTPGQDDMLMSTDGAGNKATLSSMELGMLRDLGWNVTIPVAGGFQTSRWDNFSTNDGWMSQVTGDFNGDGRDDIANFHSDTASWSVSISDGSAFDTTQWADYSPNAGWGPAVVIDANGDGKDDIATFFEGTATWWVGLSFGTRFETSLWADFSPNSGWEMPVAGDYNADGMDDIATFFSGDASWWVSLSNGHGFVTTQWADFSPTTGWTSAVGGDFDADGKDDIGLFFAQKGQWWVALSTGERFAPALWSDFSTNTGWTSHLVGDFNGDGKDDIASFHPSNGTWWVGLSSGHGFTTEQWADFSTNSGWSAQIVGDFNGDGKDDIASFHPSNGTWWVSLSRGNKFKTALWYVFSPSDGWSSQIAGDYDGDGRDDVANFLPGAGHWYVGLSPG